MNAAPDTSTPETEVTAPPLETEAARAIRDQIIAFLRTVHDPEIPVNIYDLGLIYRIDLYPDGDKVRAAIAMTLTTPGCPVAGTMPGRVQLAASQAQDVTDVKVDLVWDPPWDRSMMSEVARLELDMF